jgi:hypothetical protein
MSSNSGYSTEDFGSFKVHNLNDNYSFFHINIDNHELFYKGICDYLLSEDNLLKFIENRTAIKFEPTRKNYATLFKNLYLFIDEENLTSMEIEPEIKDILLDEFEETTDEDGKQMIRLSKIGRLGEYIFYIFLSEYFSFECIIPKIRLTTDKNMSVYGIDALFLDKPNRMILFGESKVSNRIKNGITLINKSLKKYEKEIREEYILVLSNNHLVLHGLKEVFQGKEEVCTSFEEFISEANITKIGIPIFIAHGEENDHEFILKQMQNKITRLKYFNLDTIYYAISLPIINKTKFVGFITKIIKEKMSKYESELQYLTIQLTQDR